MITGKTKSGFKFKFDERILQDWRFVKALKTMQGDDDVQKLNSISDVIMLILGSDGEQKISEHIAKKNDGFIPVEAIMEEVKEIIDSNAKIKNSASSPTV